MRHIIVYVILTAFCFAAAASAADLPQYQVKRTTGPIVLDGILDEADWAAAQSFGDFVFPWWTEGDKEQTEAKMLWDDRFLYLSFVVQDKHIWADHFNTDDPCYQDDAVELFWNPDPANLDFYQFEMNSIGNLLLQQKSTLATIMMPHIAHRIDGTLNDDSDEDTGWVLEIAVRFDEYPELNPGGTPKSGDMWRINLNRCGGETNQQFSQWNASATDRPNFHRPTEFGEIYFNADTVR